MSGGAWEYMAAYVDGHVEQSSFEDLELKNQYKDYFDVYDKDSSDNSYNKRILGDATGEMGPFLNYIEDDGKTYWHSSWYADYSDFVDASFPWFGRGGGWDNGVLAGQFYFLRVTGGAYAYGGFRLVLSISE